MWQATTCYIAWKSYFLFVNFSFSSCNKNIFLLVYENQMSFYSSFSSGSLEAEPETGIHVHLWESHFSQELTLAWWAGGSGVCTASQNLSWLEMRLVVVEEDTTHYNHRNSKRWIQQNKENPIGKVVSKCPEQTYSKRLRNRYTNPWDKQGNQGACVGHHRLW